MRILHAMDAAMAGQDAGTDAGTGSDPAAEPQDQQDQSEGESQTFFLPESFPGREGYKAGDTITLKVVGADADGDLEVECVHGKEKGKDWKSDLRASVPETAGP